MARIEPVDESAAPAVSQELAAAHVATGSRMTNMKWTLAHSPVALDALLQWYPLHDELVPVLGERRVWLFCHAISTQSDCLICSTFFRRLLIDAGEEPGELALDEFDALIVDLGRRLVVDPHSVDDGLFSALSERLTPPQLVSLMALGGDGYDIVALDVAAPLEYPPYPMGSTAELDSLAAEVSGLGRSCLTVVADVRDFSAVA